MLRVRHGRRDGGVASGRPQTLLGNRRVVVAVDQVVRDGRMVWLSHGDAFEDLGGLEGVRERLVGGQGRDVQRQGVEDRRLLIVGVGQVELLHRLLVGKGARSEVNRGRVLVHRLDGGDVALARAASMRRSCWLAPRRPGRAERSPAG